MSTTIYKKDSKGLIRVHILWTDGNVMHQKYGLLHGTQVSNETICSGKNIGRSNETNGEQQAKMLVDAKLKLKLREGYFNTIAEANGEEVVLPMLAHSFKGHSLKVKFSEGKTFAQPKLDGMRCFAIIANGSVKLISRGGKEIDTVPHIVEALEELQFEDCIIDGELYAHGLNFQENMRLLKKYRPGETEKASFNFYDVVTDDPFYKRIDEMIYIVAEIKSYGLTKTLQHVHTYPLRDFDHLKTIHAKFLADGYEGTIIRHGETGYELNKRSHNLLKYKDFIDGTYKIIDIVPSEKRPEHGTVLCELHPGGPRFKAGMKCSHEEREDYLINADDYFGKTAEIRFFEFSEDGIPRFPVFHGIRLDK